MKLLKLKPKKERFENKIIDQKLTLLYNAKTF